MTSSVAPARSRALGGIVVGVLGALSAIALSIALWPSPGRPPELGFALRAAKPTFAELPASEPSEPTAGAVDTSQPKTAKASTRATKARVLPTKTAPKPPDCKHLYYEDATGIRRVKRECL